MPFLLLQPSLANYTSCESNLATPANLRDASNSSGSVILACCVTVISAFIYIFLKNKWFRFTSYIHPFVSFSFCARLLSIAEETLTEFVSKATGTAIDWVQMPGMKVS
jgi:homeobox-leucine zipper protein